MIQLWRPAWGWCQSTWNSRFDNGNKKARKPFGCGLKLPGSGASLKNRLHAIS